jgi:glutamate dehydrogenase/leucine dehydrogenase
MNTFGQMIERGHELLCFHHDPVTDLRAIVAVHSTVLGPGFGGARRWHYATEAEALYDVLRLSEGMTYKAACAHVEIGGGKGIIMLPRPGHPPTEAEARAMGRFVESLGGVYISAEDVGLSTQYVDWMAKETKYVTGATGTGGDPSPFTAQGVVNGMKAALAHTGRPVDFAGLTVAIQGAGNVGSNVARILHADGASIVIADIHEAAVQRVVDATDAAVVAPDEILTTKCDILAPCALGGVVSGATIPRLQTEIVCGGANNILEDYDEDGAALEAKGIAYVPDFIANAGGLIELAGMHIGLTPEVRAERIEEIESTAREILADAHTHGSSFAAAVALAKRRIAAAAPETAGAT